MLYIREVPIMGHSQSDTPKYASKGGLAPLARDPNGSDTPWVTQIGPIRTKFSQVGVLSLCVAQVSLIRTGLGRAPHLGHLKNDSYCSSTHKEQDDCAEKNRFSDIFMHHNLAQCVITFRKKYLWNHFEYLYLFIVDIIYIFLKNKRMGY